MSVDLYVGSDIGHWALEQVARPEVGTIFTLDADLGRLAVEREMEVEGPPRAPVALSVHYPRVLLPVELARYEAVYNLHPSYLPWGRGWWGFFWAIWAGEPAGATLHRMVPKVDAGPIIDQRRVALEADDSAKVLLERIRAAEKELFLAWWPRIVAGEIPPEKPQPGPGSYHTRQDVERVKAGTHASDDVARLHRALDY